MSNIVDRVAKVIADVIGEGRAPWSDEYPGIARAVLVALRDPPLDNATRYAEGMYSRRNIEAFVDDALQEPEPK